MQKPGDLAYGLDDRPPAAVIATTALQQTAVVLIWVFPSILLARAVHATPADAAALISTAFVVAGVATMLQAVRRWGLGSGFLAPVSASSAHIIPVLLAAQAGGLALVAGMTVISGAATILLARLLRHVRSLIPPEIAGAVVLIIGLSISVTGAQILLRTTDGEPPGAEEMAVALVTLAVGVALSIWGKGPLRWACMLFAMVAGTATAAGLGVLEVSDDFRGASLPVVALPALGSFGFAFDLALLPAFLVASVASALKTAGVVTSLQKLNDAGWTRPDSRSITGGVTNDGIATMLAGLGGVPPMNLGATNAAIQMATGVTSRVIAFATGGLCLVLACFPGAAAAAAQMPGAVIAATLIYSGALMMASGIQLAAARLMDTRRSLAIGLALSAALAVEAVPRLVEWMPAGLKPLMTATGFGTLAAIGLNALLRIGVRRRVTLTVPGGEIRPAEVDEFVTGAGAAWGARREVVSRLSHLVASCMDAIAVSGVARGDVAIAIAHDETTLDLRIAWQGAPLVLADRPPTPDEMIDDEDAPARLAGHMIRRLSDRVRLREKGGTVELLLTLDQ
ncbi:solute carrier family 23 protein [Falsiroseomonas sp. HW251]|uniref:solute carrier family 23 protein n=1 Tax=Falsiroseomonas sp. HW251 TaxID=3390998 RepID=UPI003D31D6B0